MSEFLDAAEFPSRLWEFSLEGKFRGVIVIHDLHFLLIGLEMFASTLL